MQPITNYMYNLYGTGAGSKLDLLGQLANVANNQTNALLGAYSGNSLRNPSGAERRGQKDMEPHHLDGWT